MTMRAMTMRIRRKIGRGIGVSRTEMQDSLREEPFGFTFNPLS